jgi:hypothetical protein
VAGNGPVDAEQSHSSTPREIGLTLQNFYSISRPRNFQQQSDDIVPFVRTSNRIHSNIPGTNGSRTTKIRDAVNRLLINKVYTKQCFLNVRKASSWCCGSMDRDTSKLNDVESSPEYV